MPSWSRCVCVYQVCLVNSSCLYLEVFLELNQLSYQVYFMIFISQVTQELKKYLSIRLQLSMAWSLRTDAHSEIANKAVNKYVPYFTQYYPDDWEALLPTSKFFLQKQQSCVHLRVPVRGKSKIQPHIWQDSIVWEVHFRIQSLTELKQTQSVQFNISQIPLSISKVHETEIWHRNKQHTTMESGQARTSQQHGQEANWTSSGWRPFLFVNRYQHLKTN